MDQVNYSFFPTRNVKSVKNVFKIFFICTNSFIASYKSLVHIYCLPAPCSIFSHLLIQHYPSFLVLILLVPCSIFSQFLFHILLIPCSIFHKFIVPYSPSSFFKVLLVPYSIFSYFLLPYSPSSLFHILPVPCSLFS